MAIKIQTKQTGIPIEIGEHTFYFDTSDESIANFHNNYEKVMKDLDSINVEGANIPETLEASKGVLKKGFDLFLGEGAFEKIYKMSPSVTIIMQYFVQIAEGIEEELNERVGVSQQEKAKKYAKSKKKK